MFLFVYDDETGKTLSVPVDEKDIEELTDEWKHTGISDNRDYAALTNILTQTWSGKSIQQYKKLKGLRKENLRDNMTNTEFVLNQLAEVSTTELAKNNNPTGYKYLDIICPRQKVFSPYRNS